MGTFSELVKQHRQMLHLTQEEYAKRFGAESATSVSFWESGKRKVPERVLEELLGMAQLRFSICPYCSGRGMLENKVERPANEPLTSKKAST